MTRNWKSERAWIKKKLSNGTHQAYLRDCVGVFSNKTKKKVMQEKNLNKSQYKKRYDFLSRVYYLLCNEQF